MRLPEDLISALPSFCMQDEQVILSECERPVLVSHSAVRRIVDVLLSQAGTLILFILGVLHHFWI